MLIMVPNKIVVQFFKWLEEHNVTFGNCEETLGVVSPSFYGFDLMFKYNNDINSYVIQVEDRNILTLIHVTFTIEWFQPEYPHGIIKMIMPNYFDESENA